MVDLAALYKDTGDVPWVVGLSGGKDSTALTMLLLETMEQLPPRIRNRKKVYVTCVNTLVEAPPVIDHVRLPVSPVAATVTTAALLDTDSAILAELSVTVTASLVTATVN